MTTQSYNKKEQDKILEKEYRELVELKEPESSNEDNITDILEHIMYVGNFYKNDVSEFRNEEEYRILINIHIHGNPIIDELLPRRYFKNGKHYAEIKFCPQAIKKVICATKFAKELLEKEVIDDLKIEIRNIQ